MLNATRQLMVIPKADFADCFKMWKKRLNKYNLYPGCNNKSYPFDFTYSLWYNVHDLR